MIFYPQMLLTLVAAWYVRNRSQLNIRQIFASLMDGHQRSLFQLITCIIVQFFLIGMTLFMQFSKDSHKSSISVVLIYLTIAVSTCALYLVIRLIMATKTNAIRSTSAQYIEDINDMFTSVRGQRHDFLNHVQVIHTMAQMGKLEQLQAYTKTLVHATHEVNEIVNYASPVLAAFAQAKSTVAIGRGIYFECEFPNEWDVPDSVINPLDLIKVLGNLVDNAFDESELLPAEQRLVRVQIKKEQEYLQLEIMNRGRYLSDDLKIRMFQSGYSTKGEGHSGLGLAIVKERVSYYNGQITVQSDIEKCTTSFIIRLPYDVNLAG